MRQHLTRTRLLLLAAAMVACGGAAPTAIDPTDRGALFDAYWGAFDAMYPAFPLKGVDWHAQRDRYRPLAVATTSTTELVGVLRDMTNPLHDYHARLNAPDGTDLPTWTSPNPINWDRTQWFNARSTIGFHQTGPVLGYATLTNGIVYVLLGSWVSSYVSVAAADTLLDLVRGAGALIVDVRMNGGGNDQIALAVAGRFLSQPRSAGTVRFRNGPAYTDLGAPIGITASPRGARLTMPVLLLTGRGVTSSNEEFVEVMRQEPSVTTFGDTTGGASGNPANLTLLPGWTYTVPRWLHLDSNGVPLEGHGIAPKVYSPWDSVAAQQGRDVVLEAAVARIRALSLDPMAARTPPAARPAQATDTRASPAP